MHLSGGLINIINLTHFLLSFVYPLSRNVPGCVNLQNKQQNKK